MGRDVVDAWLLVARTYANAARAFAQAASRSKAWEGRRRDAARGSTRSPVPGRLRTDPPEPAGHEKSPAA